jgi:hypothetical protein
MVLNLLNQIVHRCKVFRWRRAIFQALAILTQSVDGFLGELVATPLPCFANRASLSASIDSTSFLAFFGSAVRRAHTFIKCNAREVDIRFLSRIDCGTLSAESIIPSGTLPATFAAPLTTLPAPL